MPRRAPKIIQRLEARALQVSSDWNFLRGVRSSGWNFARRLVPVLGMLLLATPAGAQTMSRGVASLAPNLTELMFALGYGTQLVARSSACDFPAAATNLPIAGDFGRPNIEAIRRLRPELVIVTDVENPASLRAIGQGGTRTLKLSCEGWTNLMNAAIALGDAVGEPATAARWVKTMTERRARLHAATIANESRVPPPRTFIEIWRDPLTTAGGESFLDDLVTLAGGRNMARHLGPTYPHVASEWVIRENPEAVLLLYMLPSGRDLAADLRTRAGWSGITAIKNGNICTNVPPELLLRSGPRCLDGAEQLAAWFNAKFFDAAKRAAPPR